jgi:excisionase family DNA binding protein
MAEEWITTQEAAEILGVTRQHIAYLIREGIIKGQKIGRDWLTTRSAVQDYLKNRPKPGPQPRKRNDI